MIKLIKEVPLWNAGYCALYDFSEANANEANRIEAVTTVANVCRGDKGVKNPEELYQQLLTEHDGKPGSVFEFVPFSFTPTRFSIPKFSTEIFRDGSYVLNGSNLRAAINVYGNGITLFDNHDCKDFMVFKVKVPQMIVKHILRHRMLSFQEMSERTNKLREYYYCDELLKIRMNAITVFDGETPWNEFIYKTSQADFDRWQKEYKIRQELLNKGSHGLAYTTLWIAGWKQDVNGWDNFFAVRTKKPAQREIIELAEVIKQMMEE